MTKKINLNKVRKDRPRISKEERENLVKPKGDEISNKRVVKEDLEKVEKPTVIVVETPAEEDRMMELLNKLPNKDKFIKNGLRQQSSINTSDYTNCLIDILVEAKLKEGEKIRKTSYLEKYLVQGLKKDLKELGIDIK